jgi:serine/threonine-protein kinase
VGVLVVTALRTQTARADDAEALFEQGRKLADSGNYAEACPKFEQSRRLANGLGVTMYLADCFAKTGHPARALPLFREAEHMANERHDKRASAAHDRVEALEKTVPKLTIRVKSTGAGLEVKIDDQALDLTQLKEPVRLDAGSHALVASAPGKSDFSTNVQLVEGAAASVDIPELADAGQKTQATPTHAPETRDESAKTGLGPQRTVGLVVAAVGLVGLGIGTFFGIRAKSKLDDSNSGHCDGADTCDPEGLSLRSDAKGAATISTVAFALGIGCVGAGAILYLTGKKSTSRSALRVTPSAGPGGGGLVLDERF